MRHDGWPESVQLSRGSVVTVGVFDGFHLGHRALLARAVAEGRRLGLPVVLVTFDPHPRAVVTDRGAPVPLRSVADRVASAHDAGADHVVVLPFNRSMALTSAADFVRDGLVGALRCRSLVVGSNFRCGSGGRGDLPFLRRQGHELGFCVTSVDLVKTASGVCSSTRLREAIKNGEDGVAAELLGGLDAPPSPQAPRAQ